MRAGLWCLLAALLLAGGCSTNKPVATSGPARGLVPVRFADLPGWQQDDLAAAAAAFRSTCAQARPLPAGDATSAAPVVGDWWPACAAASILPQGDADAARRFFETRFTPYAVLDHGRPDGLFTGYYEPEVRGSRVASPGFPAPLLSRPPDLMQVDLSPFAPDLKGRKIVGRIEGGSLVPYFNRSEIEAGALTRRRLEILWLADPVDAFVLQIQGSGRVRLADGHVVRVTYAGQNGRPYVPIGRVLVERGQMRLEDVSMQSIRAWLAAHPDQAAAVMDQNPSYVFFRELDGLPADQGPPGAMDAALTPGRSAAVDPHALPLGAPLFVDTTDPTRDGAPIRRLFVAQDTGGAIKGPVRADLFWGWDAAAEARAGRMHESGRAWVLLPRAAGT